MRLYLSLLLLASVKAFTVQPRRNRASIVLNAKVGIFYGTSTGSTEEVAELIAEEFGSDVAEGPIEIDMIQGSVASEFAKHDALIVGTPTWNTGADTERSGTGWDEVYYGEMQDLDIAGKTVAVFGLGDSVSYAENYADASGELHDVFENLGAKMIGYTSQEGYEHETSKAIRGDLFCGLLLDAVNQEELTPERVKNWVEQLKQEGILDGATPSSVATPTPPVVTAATPEPPVADDNAAAVIAKQLEENSNLLEENITVHGSVADDGGFTPHYNPKTRRTMWVSPNGRQCYYTTQGETKTISKAMP